MQNWLNGAKGPVPAFAAAGYGQAAPEQKHNPQWHLAGSANPSRSGGGSGRYTPEPKKGMTQRALLALVLTVLLPPVGIALMWGKGIFALRGRILITVVGVIMLTVMFTLMMPGSQVMQVQPTAVKSALRTPLPTDAALNALSNMDELLAGIENKPVINTDLNDVTGQTAAETAAEVTPEPEDPMQTVVYSVSSGAKYYHKASDCKGQVNRRTLTAAQALSEGLKPCSRCKPVSP